MSIYGEGCIAGAWSFLDMINDQDVRTLKITSANPPTTYLTPYMRRSRLAREALFAFGEIGNTLKLKSEWGMEHDEMQRHSGVVVKPTIQ